MDITSLGKAHGGPRGASIARRPARRQWNVVSELPSADHKY
ncbi:hypothetical protein [Frateuria sp. YIM B11624]